VARLLICSVFKHHRAQANLGLADFRAPAPDADQLLRAFRLSLPTLQMDLTKTERAAILDAVDCILGASPPVPGEESDIGRALTVDCYDASICLRQDPPLTAGATPPPPVAKAFTLALSELSIFCSPGQPMSLRLKSRDFSLYESNSSTTLPPWDRADSGLADSSHRQDAAPVVYKTKWVEDGDAKPGPTLALEFSDPAPTAPCTMHLDLYNVTLRHAVESAWLTSTLNILFGACEGAVSPSERDVPVRILKSFVTVHNGIIDYLPAESDLASRTILTVGAARFCCNLVTGATVQAYTFLTRDLAVYLINKRIPYTEDDTRLFGAEQLISLSTRRDDQSPTLCPPALSASSIPEYLERLGYAQVRGGGWGQRCECATQLTQPCVWCPRPIDGNARCR
jgi:hypothetical protein